MIVARLSSPKALACAACAMLMAVFPWWAILAGWTGRDGAEAVHDAVIWLLLFISPWMAWAGVMLLWRLLSPNSHSVRISDGLLFYSGAAQRSIFDRFRLFWGDGFSAFRRDDRIRSIPLAEVTSFSIGVPASSAASSALAEFVNFAFLCAAIFSHDTAPVGGIRGDKGILAHLKSGGTVHIPAYLMDEPRDVILARLNQALADSRR